MITIRSIINRYDFNSFIEIICGAKEIDNIFLNEILFESNDLASLVNVRIIALDSSGQ